MDRAKAFIYLKQIYLARAKAIAPINALLFGPPLQFSPDRLQPQEQE
jgi:hypothetical protein